MVLLVLRVRFDSVYVRLSVTADVNGVHARERKEEDWEDKRKGVRVCLCPVQRLEER